MDKTRAQYLLERYYSNSFTIEERAEFILFLNHPAFEQVRSEWLDDLWPVSDEQLDTPPNYDQILTELVDLTQEPKRYPWMRLAGIAAVALVILFAGLWYSNDGLRKYFINQDLISSSMKRESVTLALSNGVEIPLDSSQGEIIITGSLLYPDGKSVLTTDIEESTQVTLIVPEKKIYAVKLPDGTRVKLNAQSSLTFPSHFSKSERRVQLQGEGYFEVHSDPQNPFFITTVSEKKTMHISVTGTKFNVNAYADDKINSVSLVEGRVAVNDRQLTPNKAFYITGTHSEIKVFDPAAALAWLNNEFYFDHESLYGVLRKVERWYGVDFQVEVEDVDIKIGGAISKDRDLDTILDILSKYADIQFNKEGKVIQVKRNK